MTDWLAIPDSSLQCQAVTHKQDDESADMYSNSQGTMKRKIKLESEKALDLEG